MAKKAGQFGKKKSGKYLKQDAKKGHKVKKAKSGTKKGMVRKTARKAYMPKAKSGTKKGMVRKTARKAYMKKGGSSRKCRSGCR